ncbi:MAG: hypothetical protein LBT05_05845 [Planctomycetaceae bacterium]|nr:hypothetical protein [Planctomycetaceae bacterium]
MAKADADEHGNPVIRTVETNKPRYDLCLSWNFRERPEYIIPISDASKSATQSAIEKQLRRYAKQEIGEYNVYLLNTNSSGGYEFFDIDVSSRDELEAAFYARDRCFNCLHEAIERKITNPELSALVGEIIHFAKNATVDAASGGNAGEPKKKAGRKQVNAERDAKIYRKWKRYSKAMQKEDKRPLLKNFVKAMKEKYPKVKWTKEGVEKAIKRHETKRERSPKQKGTSTHNPQIAACNLWVENS